MAAANGRTAATATTARKPVHDRQRTRREPGDAVRVEDVIPAEILNDTRVDREYLEQVFREPQKFLPPRMRQEPEPEPEQPPEEPESPLARRAKLVGLLAAAVLVTGSIIAAASMAGQPRTQPPTLDTGSQPLTDAAALGGFAVPGPPQSSQSTTKTWKTSVKSTAVAPAAETAVSTSQTGSPTAAAPSSQTTPWSPAPTTTRQKLEAVKNFYELIDQNPQGALSMLVPVAVGEEPGDLVRVLSSMDSIQVQDTKMQPDGSILAIVTMRQPDGSHLRISQVLRLADDASGLISDARLLSAQRM
jgi:hypothetical protein